MARLSEASEFQVGVRVSELVKAIEGLLDSPERAAKLSSQGIRQAEHLYDKKRMIDKTEIQISRITAGIQKQ